MLKLAFMDAGFGEGFGFSLFQNPCHRKSTG